MAVKKEANGRRSVQVEVEVPGTPEQVWEAIASGPGIGAWFVPTEVDGQVGGKVTTHFGGGMDSVKTITEWDAPHRFTAEGSWGPNTPNIATEWIVEAREGGTCTVRVVHSLFADTDDWDNQLTGTESGWPTFFRILRLYLEHHAGEPSSLIQVVAMPAGSAADAWEKLAGALNLAGAKEGDHRAAGDGAPPVRGIVETVISGGNPSMLLRVDAPAPGALFVNACPAGKVAFVTVNFYVYGDGAAEFVVREQPAWTAWMKKLFTA